MPRPLVLTGRPLGTQRVPRGGTLRLTRRRDSVFVQEGVKREGLEETGLHFQPTAILTVESQRYWRRFTFTGCIVGGTLKTTENSDKESLQAKWLCVDKIESDLPLRFSTD